MTSNLAHDHRLPWINTRARRAGIAALALPLLAVTPATAKVPKRVIALTPYSANTMAKLGTKPVAIGQVVSGKNLFDASLSGVERLPLTHPAGPNLEQVSKLRADYAFTADTWKRGTTGLKRLGLRVADREPGSVTEVPKQTVRIGAILGKRAAATRLATQQVNAINAATKGIKKRPKVMVILGVGSTPYAFLPNSWGGDVIRYAGGQLITGGQKSSSGFARISDEFVVARNPDVIIAVPHGNPKDIPKIAKQLAQRPGWRTTKAARNKRIYISTSNTLLQPIVGVAPLITSVRRSYLKN